jgi:hypothetical protein
MAAHRGSRQAARGAAVTALAAALVLLLTGASAGGSSLRTALTDAAAHLGSHVSGTVATDGVLAPRSSHHEPAPGQRATPGALPGAPLLALVTGLLLVAALASRPAQEPARQRLPHRRGPPRDAFSR